jgi:hypothetical protein
MTDMENIKKALERAEGYVAAAAFKEASEPPYEPGRACKDLVEVREALAALTKETA